jgi:hypothetical protein
MVKTSLQLPDELWKAAKIHAAEQRMDFRSVVIAALDAYLKAQKRPKAKR